jgi:hypothetical protein
MFMRKILIIVVLVLNVNSGNFVNAQVPCPPGYSNYGPTYPGGPLPSASGSGTSPSWWSSFTTFLGYFGISVGQLFNQSNPPPSPLSAAGSSLFGSYYFNQYQPQNNGLGGGSSSSGVDCFGVVSGTAYEDKCGVCVGGASQLVACDAVLLNDTLKPEKYPCPSDAIARDLKSDHIFNYIKDSSSNSYITKNAIDSAPFRSFEVGYSIRQFAQPFCSTCPTYKPDGYNVAGATQNVAWGSFNNSIGDAHVHTAKTALGGPVIESPSARDYSEFIKNAIDPSYVKGFTRKYVFSGDSAHSIYAAVVEDTVKIRQFFINNPIDSFIQTNPNLPNVHNWKGDTTNANTFFYEFNYAIEKFRVEGYPTRLLDTYANVYMLDKLKIGIKLQTLVNGSFKELKFEETIDSSTGKKHFKIKICD